MPYRAKPIEVEALRLRHQTADGDLLFLCDSCGTIADCLAFLGPWGRVDYDGRLLVQTHGGYVTASAGDWIVKRSFGNYCLCEHKVFTKTYEPTE